MVLSEKTDRVSLPINDQREQVENVASEHAHVERFHLGNASKLALEYRLPGLVLREPELRLHNNRIGLASHATEPIRGVGGLKVQGLQYVCAEYRPVRS